MIVLDEAIMVNGIDAPVNVLLPPPEDLLLLR